MLTARPPGERAFCARNVHDDRVASPSASRAAACARRYRNFFHELDARISSSCALRFEAAIERHRNRPRPRKHRRVLDRHLVARTASVRDRREALRPCLGPSRCRSSRAVQPVALAAASRSTASVVALPEAAREKPIAVSAGGSSIAVEMNVDALALRGRKSIWTLFRALQ